MNITFLRREVFMLLLFFSGLNSIAQSFTEAASFTTGTDYTWKNSYTFWIDVDNDTDLDILNIEAESGGVSKLFINDNPGFHEGPSLPFTIGDNASVGDFDRDGFVDFVMLGIPVIIYRNNHNQTFSAMPDNTVPSTILITGESIDCGDYDNDGDLDIYIANLNSRGMFLRNNKGNQNNWLMINLIGTASNRDAIGSRVKITSGGKVQTTQKKSTSGYLSQNDHRLHFGIAKNELVEEIEIKWPSGKVQVIENTKANQILTVTEP